MSDELVAARVPGVMYKWLKKQAGKDMTISQYLRKLIREAMAKEKP
jgi:hypothetical protein